MIAEEEEVVITREGLVARTRNELGQVATGRWVDDLVVADVGDCALFRLRIDGLLIAFENRNNFPHSEYQI